MRFRRLSRSAAARLAWLLALSVALCGCSSAPGPAAPTHEASVRPGVNEAFLSEDLDVARYTEIFEGESREIAASRDAIVQALGLAPGATVADIGAGTGLFLRVFSRQVGERGRVVAVEIAPRFIEHLRERAASEGLANVVVHAGTERAVGLEAASVDLAFVCDTYHHFEYPAATLESLFEALRPGAILVIVDFKREPNGPPAGRSPDWVLGHVRAGQGEVTREIEAAGFTFERQVLIAGLRENYMLRFVRP